MDLAQVEGDLGTKKCGSEVIREPRARVLDRVLGDGAVKDEELRPLRSCSSLPCASEFPNSLCHGEILSFIGFFLCRALYFDRGVNFKVKDVDKVSIIFVISLHHAAMARYKLRRHHYHYHYY